MEESSKTFKCDKCHKAFTHRPNLYRHITQIHKDAAFHCTKCKKTFNRQDLLKKHQLREVCKKNALADQMYSCGLCKFQSFTKSNVERHKKSIHGVVVEKMDKQKMDKQKETNMNIECNTCGMFFRLKRDLKLHKKLICSEVSPKIKLPSFLYKTNPTTSSPLVSRSRRKLVLNPTTAAADDLQDILLAMDSG